MAWGMPLATFTFVHVVLSLIGIGSGLVVMSALLRGRERGGWTALFLATTVATSVTGFGFPVDHLLPSHIVGIISLLAVCGDAGRRASAVHRPHSLRSETVPQ